MGDGRTVLHDTQVGELWGANQDRWPHIIFRRAYQNARHLIETGKDPLRIISEPAHENGLLFYPTLLVQQGRGDPERDTRGSTFRFTHKHLDIGAAGDIDCNYGGFDCADFKHEEIRNERVAHAVRSSGANRVLIVRIPASIKGCLAIGMDISEQGQHIRDAETSRG